MGCCSSSAIPVDGVVVNPREIGRGPAGFGTVEGQKENDRININVAAAADLRRIPGIGPKRAQSIISYRAEHGPFRSLTDLTHVPGIGEALVEKLEAQICFDVCPVQTHAPAKPTGSPKKSNGVHEALFFPDDKDNNNFKRLLKFINEAKESIDVAVFAIRQDDLAQAILAAHQRDISVRVITDDEQAKQDGSDIEFLRKRGVQVRKDNNTKLHMHHKFAVVDKQIVLNGSFNWTPGAVKGSNENIIVSHSLELAESFTKAFDCLWAAFAKGHSGIAGSFNLLQHNLAVLFFPESGSSNFKRIEAEISAAKNNLDIAMFTLTNDRLVDIMVQRHRAGVRVRVITDNRQSECLGCDVEKLRSVGIEVRMDSSPFAMHHKFAVIDKCTVLNGSFNWTAQAANGNQENVVIYNRQREGLAMSFSTEFEQLWKKFEDRKS